MSRLTSRNQIMSPEHYCNDIVKFPTNKFLQLGVGKGRKILIIGESPAPSGWRKSGRAFHTVDGRLLASGRNLNTLLANYGLSIGTCAFTELVKCYVGKNKKLLDECGRKCWPIFKKQLKTYKFRLLITLGVKTLGILNRQLGTQVKIGKLSEIKIEGGAYIVLPIYHPSPANPYNQINNQHIFEKSGKELEQMISNLD